MATILVLDSDALVRNFVTTVLSRNGHKVFEAAQAAEASKVADSFEGTIDLLLISGHLPDASGANAPSRLLQGRPEMRIIHMLWWPAMSLWRENAPGCGAGYLQKPFSAKELLQEVKRVLEEEPEKRE